MLAVLGESSKDTWDSGNFFKWGTQGMPEFSEAEKLVALGTSLFGTPVFGQKGTSSPVELENSNPFPSHLGQV